MKSLFVVALAVLTQSQFANAVYRPGWERPIMRAQMAFVEGNLPYPQMRTLTINRRQSSKVPTSFTVFEDTGIRCITTPCPSFRTVQFKIEKVSPSLHNSDVVRYEAVEILKNIQPNVRMAPRRLTVTESSMELVKPGGAGFVRITHWDAEMVTFSAQTQAYSGKPTPVYTIANVR